MSKLYRMNSINIWSSENKQGKDLGTTRELQRGNAVNMVWMSGVVRETVVGEGPAYRIHRKFSSIPQYY